MLVEVPKDCSKNLKLLNKKPLIAHTIDLALSVPGNVDIVVSSDSDNILKVAKSYGVENTVKRPSPCIR